MTARSVLQVTDLVIPPSVYDPRALRAQHVFKEHRSSWFYCFSFLFVPFLLVRVVNVSSGLGDLRCVSPALRNKFSSPNLTVTEITSLMEKYRRDAKEGKVTENGWPDDSSSFTPAYSVSKIGVTAMSMVQARELKNDQREGILVNAVCPGWVRTDMGGPNAERSPEEGADTPVYCALLPKGTTSPNGEFLQNRKSVPWLPGKL